MAEAQVPAPRLPVIWRVLLGVVAATLILGTLSAAVILLKGDRFYIVGSPSMGQIAPVGTLLIDEPVAGKSLNVGDIITFRPPKSKNLYTHRIVKIDQGQITTKGDIAPVDPWILTEQNVVGRVTTIVPMLGWLIRALPILIAGCLVVWVIAHQFRARHERAAAIAIFGTCLVVVIATIVIDPLLGVSSIGLTLDDQGTTMQNFVSTGILPIRVTAERSQLYTDLVAGQVGSLPLTHPDAAGRVHFSAAPQLSLWWWLSIVAICLSPTLIGLSVRRSEVAAKPDPEPQTAKTAAP